MNLSPSALWAHAKSPEGRKQLRYAGISVVFVPLGQILIQVLGKYAFDRNYTAASVVSALILTTPNFFANKYLVWRETSRDNMTTQVTVFWIAAIIGVSFATGLTWLVEQQFHDDEAWIEGSAVFFAQLFGFGVVWVARYLVLDRWIFKATHHGAEPTPEELGEMHSEFPV